MQQTEWASVATAPDQEIAEMWVEMLHTAGIDGVVSPEDAISFLGISARPCRVLVPESQLEAAQEALSGLTGEVEPESSPE